MADDKITTEASGAPEKGPAPTAAPGYSPVVGGLLRFGAHLLFGIAVGVVTLLVLWTSGNDRKMAMLVGLLVAIVAANLAKYIIRWPAVQPQPQLPPGVKPSGAVGREAVEMVVFVVVLVLLLKSFAAEAFVIPTGSMAETLWGYQKVVTCPSCQYEFPVNCSKEVDPQEGQQRQPIEACACPNCRQGIRLIDPRRDGREPRSGKHFDPRFDVLGDLREVADPGWSSGDRVLVGKFLYDFGRLPNRLDVVVFKFPDGPQKDQTPMNYIKRLIGLPGETIAVFGGDLYVLPPEKQPDYGEETGRPEDRWKSDYLHKDHPDAVKLFTQTDSFRIIRKPPDILLSMMRIVYDADHPASDLKGWPRWKVGEGWEEAGKGFRHPRRAEGADEIAWLDYQHVLRDKGGRRTLITDFMGYNTYQPSDAPRANGENWCGDLIVECEVTVEKPEGELVLQLGRGHDRFQAVWDLASPDGTCTLKRLDPDNPQKPAETLASAPTRLRKGTYKLRFANVDRRLTVWVDNTLPFEEGVTYQPHAQRGPWAADLNPASVGVRGPAVLSVQHLKLFRDTYHTVSPSSPDHLVSDWSDDKSADWEALRTRLPVLTMYVQPGHFLCLGDNSPHSSDSRYWGAVPERLLLGRALLVYYPFDRAGRIR